MSINPILPVVSCPWSVVLIRNHAHFAFILFILYIPVYFKLPRYFKYLSSLIDVFVPTVNTTLLPGEDRFQPKRTQFPPCLSQAPCPVSRHIYYEGPAATGLVIICGTARSGAGFGFNVVVRRHAALALNP